MREFCGPPVPEGFGEWTGCVLFHHGWEFSTLGLLGLFALGLWLGMWLQRRRIGGTP